MVNEEELEDADWEKAVGQYRLQVGAVLRPLRLYGQAQYVVSAIEELVSLALQLHLKLSGVEMPFHINEDKLHY